MQLKRHKMWGIPVLVTFDGGCWFWDKLFERVVFVPHGHKGRNWNWPPVTVYFRRYADNCYRGAAKLATRSELRRLAGEFEYDVDEDARRKFFETLGTATLEARE